MRVSNQATKGQVINFTLQNVSANDPNGQPIQLNVIDKLNVIVSVQSKPNAALPETFVLYANTPNPFNPATTIKYDLAQPREVILEIFDMLGHRVRTLVSEHQQAGRYEVSWDGRDEQGRAVSSGVFIYQLRAGSFMQTRKMVLLQ
jgi:hypothetical protein